MECLDGAAGYINSIDRDALGNKLKMAYMVPVSGEELPIETQGSSEFIENRLRLRKYFREFKLHSTSFWRDSAPKTDW